MQLCAKQADGNGNGQRLRHIQAAKDGNGAATHACGTFIPNDGTARCGKGQKHGLDHGADHDRGGHIAQDDAAEQRGHQGPAENMDQTIYDTCCCKPIIGSKDGSLKNR